MNCPKCNSRLVRAKRGHKTQENTTEIEVVDLWACQNKRCEWYAGEDLQNPEHVAKRDSAIIQSVDY